MAVNFVRVRIFWTSIIFVIIVFPYTHDTGTVTVTEPGVEFLHTCVNRDKYCGFPTFQYLLVVSTRLVSTK